MPLLTLHFIQQQFHLKHQGQERIMVQVFALSSGLSVREVPGHTKPRSMGLHGAAQSSKYFLAALMSLKEVVF